MAVMDSEMIEMLMRTNPTVSLAAGCAQCLADLLRNPPVAATTVVGPLALSRQRTPGWFPVSSFQPIDLQLHPFAINRYKSLNVSWGFMAQLLMIGIQEVGRKSLPLLGDQLLSLQMIALRWV